MSNFPTLTRKPQEGFEEEYEDSVLRSDFEGGYEITRQKYTRMRKSFKNLKWVGLNATDKTAMDTFVTTTVKGGADSFNWTHPVTNTVHVVRFVKPPVFSPKFDGSIWEMTCELREV